MHGKKLAQRRERRKAHQLLTVPSGTDPTIAPALRWMANAFDYDDTMRDLLILS
jgi:hypothetical protein